MDYITVRPSLALVVWFIMRTDIQRHTNSHTESQTRMIAVLLSAWVTTDCASITFHCDPLWFYTVHGLLTSFEVHLKRIYTAYNHNNVWMRSGWILLTWWIVGTWIMRLYNDSMNVEFSSVSGRWCEPDRLLNQSIHQPTERTGCIRRELRPSISRTGLNTAEPLMNADCTGSRRRAGNGSWLRTWYRDAINTVTWSICLHGSRL